MINICSFCYALARILLYLAKLLNRTETMPKIFADLPRTTKQKIILGLIIFTALLALLFLGPVLRPFLIGLFLAYLGNPLVKRLMRFGLSRMVAVALVFAFIFIGITGLVLLAIPIVETQISTLISSIPDIFSKMVAQINSVFSYVGVAPLDGATVKKIVAEHFSKSNDLASWAVISGIKFFEVVIEIIIIPFVTFYLLRDWEKLVELLNKTTRKRSLLNFDGLLDKCASALNAFLRGQLLVVLCMSIFYMITFTLAGLKVGIVVGLIMGLLTFIPYIGSIIGICLASAVALTQTGAITPLIWVLLSYAIGHLMENFYLTPKLIGDKIGLHPVIVILVILLGGTLFGVGGVILALPASSVGVILAHYFYTGKASDVPAPQEA